MNGHLEVVKLLVDRGGDPNAKVDIDGSTPLHRASENGHLEVVKLLVDRGGDPNAKNRVCTLFTTTYDLICLFFLNFQHKMFITYFTCYTAYSVINAYCFYYSKYIFYTIFLYSNISLLYVTNTLILQN